MLPAPLTNAVSVLGVKTGLEKIWISTSYLLLLDLTTDPEDSLLWSGPVFTTKYNIISCMVVFMSSCLKKVCMYFDHTKGEYNNDKLCVLLTLVVFILGFGAILSLVSSKTYLHIQILCTLLQIT